MSKRKHIDGIERWHRQDSTRKVLDEMNWGTVRRCTNPTCQTGWMALDDGWFCADCHQRVLDRAEWLRRRAARRAEGSDTDGVPATTATPGAGRFF